MRTPYLAVTLGIALAWSLACGSSDGPGGGEDVVEDGKTFPGSGTRADPFVVDCSTRGRDLPIVGDKTAFKCPQGCDSGSVWGTCTYTTDSSLCRAAQHAGAFSTRGGANELLLVDGKSSYKGSTQNKVTSSDWGSYDQSFTFARMSDSCATGQRNPGERRGGGRNHRGGDRDRDVRRR